MKLESLLLADAANESGGKLNILGGGITRLTPPTFPWIQPTLTLILRAHVDDADFGRDRSIEIRCETPDGKLAVPAIRGEVQAAHLEGVQERAFEGELRFVQLVTTLNGLPFGTPGLYRFTVSIDGELFAEYPLVVDRA